MVVVNLVNLINIIAFVGLTFATYTTFYFSTRMTPEKKITMNIFILSLGINLIGLSHLFRLWMEAAQPFFITTTLAVGSIFTFIGIVNVFHEKSIEMISLRKRQEEIKSIISALKEKYYQQEISEEELKSVHTSLLKELAEIEVKLKSEELKGKKSSK